MECNLRCVLHLSLKTVLMAPWRHREWPKSSGHIEEQLFDCSKAKSQTVPCCVGTIFRAYSGECQIRLMFLSFLIKPKPGKLLIPRVSVLWTLRRRRFPPEKKKRIRIIRIREWFILLEKRIYSYLHLYLYMVMRDIIVNKSSTSNPLGFVFQDI